MPAAPGIYRKALNTAGAGDFTVDTPNPGCALYVVNFHLFAGGTVNVKFTDGAAGTVLLGQYNMLAGQSVQPGDNDSTRTIGANYWAITTPGVAASNPLMMNLSAAIQVGGAIIYEIRTAL